mgnify:CR=1 FL=1
MSKIMKINKVDEERWNERTQGEKNNKREATKDREKSERVQEKHIQSRYSLESGFKFYSLYFNSSSEIVAQLQRS